MKEKLVKAFGYVMFYTMALGTCMLLGALAYTGVSKIAPLPEGLPASLPTRGPPPTPTPTITPTPTAAPTPTPAPFPIEIRNRTEDETIGDRLAALISDAGYNVAKVTTGSTKEALGGDPFERFKVTSPELTGPEVRLANDICRFLDIDCELWAGYTGDVADVLIEVGDIHDWDEWLSERGY